jgi:hypothetical protein
MNEVMNYNNSVLLVMGIYIRKIKPININNCLVQGGGSVAA